MTRTLWTSIVFLVAFASVLIGIVCNGLLVYWLETNRPDLFVRLGKPGIMFFAGVQWMTNSAYTDFVFTARREDLNDPEGWARLRNLRLAMAGFFISFVAIPVVLFR